MASFPPAAIEIRTIRFIIFNQLNTKCNNSCYRMGKKTKFEKDNGGMERRNNRLKGIEEREREKKMNTKAGKKNRRENLKDKYIFFNTR